MIKTMARHYPKLVFFGAVYDVISTGGFAFPGLAGIELDLLRQTAFGAGMAGAFPAFEPLHLFFVNLMGSMVLTWAVLRIVKPLPVFGLFDGITEILFSSWMFYYNVVCGINDIILIFLVLEIVWCILHIAGFFAWRSVNGSWGFGESAPA